MFVVFWNWTISTLGVFSKAVEWKTPGQSWRDVAKESNKNTSWASSSKDAYGKVDVLNSTEDTLWACFSLDSGYNFST